MIYLSEFVFPDDEEEYVYLFRNERMTCYDYLYPFGILGKKNLKLTDLEQVTILYGGNGCGKTTALNVIAEKLGLSRGALFNKTTFFDKYVSLCRSYSAGKVPGAFIASDDVFDYMLDLRSLNEGIDQKREELFKEYDNTKYSDFKFKTMEDYETLKKVNLARRKTMTKSKYVRLKLNNNARERSNGESAFMYFTEKIKEDALYLLDEPENSLSPDRQIELAKFIEDSARYFGCQFIIATHSPFLLSIENAKIYDLDGGQGEVRRWTELKNVLTYYNFFKKHRTEFEEHEYD